MIIWYTVLLIGVLSLIFWQYIGAALSRIATYREIKRLCQAGKIDIKLMNGSYFTAKNKNDGFDFILKIGNTVLPVKFYSALSTRDTAYIDPRGKVCVRGTYRKPLSRSGRPEGQAVKRFYRLPSMKIRKDFISKKYTIYPVFLNEPPFRSVKLVDKLGRSTDLYDTSGIVAGCRWLDKETFISLVYAYASKRKDQTDENNGRATD